VGKFNRHLKRNTEFDVLTTKVKKTNFSTKNTVQTVFKKTATKNNFQKIRIMKSKTIITFCLMIFGITTTYAQNLKPFKADNGKYGYKDTTGKIVVRPIYSKAKTFSEGLGAVYMEKGDIRKWGFIDEKGKVIIPFNWADVGDFHEGLAVVIAGFYFDKVPQWGAIDKEGKITIPLIYEYLEDFVNGRAKVELNGRTFYIDKSGKEVK